MYLISSNIIFAVTSSGYQEFFTNNIKRESRLKFAKNILNLRTAGALALSIILFFLFDSIYVVIILISAYILEAYIQLVSSNKNYFSENKSYFWLNFTKFSFFSSFLFILMEYEQKDILYYSMAYLLSNIFACILILKDLQEIFRSKAKIYSDAKKFLHPSINQQFLTNSDKFYLVYFLDEFAQFIYYFSNRLKNLFINGLNVIMRYLNSQQLKSKEKEYLHLLEITQIFLILLCVICLLFFETYSSVLISFYKNLNSEYAMLSFYWLTFSLLIVTNGIQNKISILKSHKESLSKLYLFQQFALFLTTFALMIIDFRYISLGCTLLILSILIYRKLIAAKFK